MNGRELALQTILQKSTAGIPSCLVFLMEHDYIEKLAGAAPGDYRQRPEEVYLRFQQAVGTCMLDQYIPFNPLSMGQAGYENGAHGATTGAHDIVLDGIRIDSPEAVVEHMERWMFPRIQKRLEAFDEENRVKEILAEEERIQKTIGDSILKAGYGFILFPEFHYYTYGYENYFMSYALYPEVMELCFSLEADYALLNNRAAARAFREGGLPPYYRLDHDMADSRGTLVDIKSLDRLWFPHFARCLEPLLKSEVRLIWHCDGNLMQMVPRLLEVGLKGFQGFQYEDGMDYRRICRTKTRNGDDLLIVAGVSVTRTLPHGTPEDIRKELKWLVDNGPTTGLFLGGSSSITPGAPWENVKALLDGLKYYRENGRNTT